MTNFFQRDKNETVTSHLPKETDKGLKLIPTVILLSFFFGLIGSVIGLRYFGSKSQSLTNNGVVTVQVDEQSAIVDVVKRASPAVVSIIITKDLNKVPGFSSSPFDFRPFSFDSSNIQEVGGGSGFIISSDGLVVTNKHVVNDATAQYTVLTNDGNRYQAKILSRDPVNDLALVKIEGKNFSTLALGDSSKIEIGQKAIAIGNSLAQYRNTVTTGVVSGIGRTIIASGSFGSEQLEGVIQTDAAINPGNSGGPLLDIGGSVIGINTAIDSQGQLVGFAIPVNDLKKDIESFNKFGRIIKPFLGVQYVLINQTIKEENKLAVDYGALIVPGTGNSSPAVVPNSAAEKAGIKQGDIILEVNGQRVDKNQSLAGILKNYNPGDVVKMKILSEDQEKEIAVTLGETK